MYGDFNADWLPFADLSVLYRDVSAIRIVMDIKANARANMKLEPVDLNGEKIKKETATKEQAKIIKLMENPNPIQGTWEFLRLTGLFKEIWGRSFVHANVPSGMEVRGIDGTTIKTLMPLPSQYMFPIYTGKILTSTERSEIISGYELRFGTKKQDFNTNHILDRSDSNVSYFDNVINDIKTDYHVNSCSKLLSLNKEITNYVKAMEGRNVTTKNLGMRGIISSAKKDSVGVFSLIDKEEKAVQKKLDSFGAMDGQKRYMFTPHPVSYQNTAFSPKELMLIEETYHTMIAIANVCQVPEGLIPMYISNSGKETAKEDLKRLYTQTIIPESKDTADDLNDFLKTEKYGMRFVASFDHLDFLQEDKKDKSIRLRNTNIAYRDMFKAGAIKYNTWLRAVEEPTDSEFGDKRIFDLTPQQVATVLGTTISNDIPKK